MTAQPPTTQIVLPVQPRSTLHVVIGGVFLIAVAGLFYLAIRTLDDLDPLPPAYAVPTLPVWMLTPPALQRYPTMPPWLLTPPPTPTATRTPQDTPTWDIVTRTPTTGLTATPEATATTTAPTSAALGGMR